jgi:predicted ATPase
MTLVTSATSPSSLPAISITEKDLFPKSLSDKVVFAKSDWNDPVTFFVGRNGSRKSRTARAIAKKLDGRILITDRLLGLMASRSVGYLHVPTSDNFRGLPLGDEERKSAGDAAKREGVGVDDLYALRDQPDVWLRVAAFIKRALHRDIDLRVTSGYLDPHVTLGSMQYSLLRDEGHGLRELTILLAATFRQDWNLLVIDEPELHLHPSMARLWLGELERVCRNGDRRAIVVTHEPSLVRPKRAEDLAALWHFQPGGLPAPLSAHIRIGTESRVTASLSGNPELVSSLIFSPRPVLVEGTTDVVGITVALNRIEPPEVVAQTDLVECGGRGGVALWYEIANRAKIDVRAIADLDACLAPEVQSVLDRSDLVTSRYRADFAIEPPKTSTVVHELIQAMNAAGVEKNEKGRAKWLATNVPQGTGWSNRKSKLLSIWRDAGIWLHAEGTLEDVLGGVEKDRHSIMQAAAVAGKIDDVARWCAFDIDPLGDIETLLGAEVERIAHSVMQSSRRNPGIRHNAPVGPTAEVDSKLVTLTADPNGDYRITVVKPDEFAGYWLTFSRDTPTSALNLRPPSDSDP